MPFARSVARCWVSCKACSSGTIPSSFTELQHGTASMMLTNYPRSGPVFSGPHEQPFICMTATFVLPVTGETLGPALDADCSIATRIDYVYWSTAGLFKHLPDPTVLPPDVATTTTNQGTTVRYSACASRRGPSIGQSIGGDPPRSDHRAAARPLHPLGRVERPLDLHVRGRVTGRLVRSRATAWGRPRCCHAIAGIRDGVGLAERLCH